MPFDLNEDPQRRITSQIEPLGLAGPSPDGVFDGRDVIPSLTGKGGGRSRTLVGHDGSAGDTIKPALRPSQPTATMK